MNDDSTSTSYNWENDEAKVVVPYSVAGVSTSIVITSKFTGKIILLDAGDGVLRDLISTCNSEFLHDLDIIAVTHGHFDHIGGLYALLGFLRMLERKEPLSILVPAGCVEVPLLIQSFRHSYPTSIPFRIFIQEVGNHTGFDTDFFKVKAFEVEHFGMENISNEERLMPALGYRVHIGSTIVSYTGDTRYCSSAEDIVRDADLAIIEATRRKPPLEGHRVHLTIEEANRLAALAKNAILVHKIPDFVASDGVD
ncbi:MAG: MBL fold metallo-hydrolase [Candidatus Thorarchaeota archaeon]